MIEPFSFGKKPTLVPTGVRALMNDDEVLELYNRSSNPITLGLVLVNSVGIIDADYSDNESNDIMFAFYNMSDCPVELKVGDKIGQGIFRSILKPDDFDGSNLQNRVGGFGSTDS